MATEDDMHVSDEPLSEEDELLLDLTEGILSVDDITPEQMSAIEKAEERFPGFKKECLGVIQLAEDLRVAAEYERTKNDPIPEDSMEMMRIAWRTKPE